MTGETKLISNDELDASSIHDLNTLEVKICLFIVNGGMSPDVVAQNLGITKNKINQIMKKPETQAFVNYLKKKLTVNAIQTTTNQLKALQDKAFSALIERFDDPDHTRDLPADALPEQIKLYYQGYARYTPLDKVHKIYESVAKMNIENTPESEKNNDEDISFEKRVRARFEEKKIKQKRFLEAAQQKGIPSSQLADLIGGEFLDVGPDGSVQILDHKQSDEADYEVVERTVTVEGTPEDINKLSLFNMNKEKP